MDGIGAGSMQIVALTGFFSGAVMAMKMSRALRYRWPGGQELACRRRSPWFWIRSRADGADGGRAERLGYRQRTGIHESY